MSEPNASGDLAGQLQEMLGDPELMQKLSGIAQSLSVSSAGGEKSDGKSGNEEKQKGSSRENDRIRLLNALAPYLSPKRQEAAKTVSRLLELKKLIDIDKLF